MSVIENSVDENTQVIPTITDQAVESNVVAIEQSKPEVQPVIDQTMVQVQQTSSFEQPIVQPVQLANNQSNQELQKTQTLPVQESKSVQSQMSNESQLVNPEQIQKAKKSNTKWIFIILGIVLVGLALVLLFVALNKSSNSSIIVLEKSLNNLVTKGENSGTVNANILIESNTSDSMNLSASVKYAKNNDAYNLALTLNKSLLYEEMNLYSTVTEDKLTLYAKSSLIDMLGTTSSDNDMWLYYIMDLTEMITEQEIQNNVEDINLSKVIDEKHFIYVDKIDNLKHYQFIIDNELIRKLDSQSGEEIYDVTDTITSLKEQYIIDMYINESDELVKVSVDLTELVTDSDISSVVITIELLELNNTTVIIPQEALNSQIDLETYMSTYALVSEDYGTGTGNEGTGDDIYYDQGNNIAY